MNGHHFMLCIGLTGWVASLCPDFVAAQDISQKNSEIVAAQPVIPLARGFYLLRISGCNDCHTPGYAESGGQTPQAQWLTGNSVGFRGPWGTTFPTNLRLYMRQLSEMQWLQRARQPMRPPMPWFALRDMSDADLRAIYVAVRYLGPAGAPAPAYVPPQQIPDAPYIDFVPQTSAR
jgi:mono/diheme cytochrome c family protein